MRHTLPYPESVHSHVFGIAKPSGLLTPACLCMQTLHSPWRAAAGLARLTSSHAIFHWQPLHCVDTAPWTWRLQLVVKTASHFPVTLLNQICGLPTDARASPWLTALGPSLPSRLIALLSKDGTDISTDTWCWQALYLVQAQLTLTQQAHILQHPTAQRVSPSDLPPSSLVCVLFIWSSVLRFMTQSCTSWPPGYYIT